MYSTLVPPFNEQPTRHVFRCFVNLSPSVFVKRVVFFFSRKHQNGRTTYVMSWQLTVYTVTNLEIFSQKCLMQNSGIHKSCVLAAPYFASTCIFVLQVDFAQSWAASCSQPPGICRVMLMDDGLEKVIQLYKNAENLAYPCKKVKDSIHQQLQ